MSVTPREARRALEHQGRYAGAVTRLLAYLADIAIISVLFGATLALVTAAIDVATPWTLDVSKDSTPVLVFYLVLGGASTSATAGCCARSRRA